MVADRDLVAAMARFDRVVLQRDLALAEQVLHPDYALVLVQPVPAVMPRAQWLALLPDYLVDEWDTEEQSVDVNGDCAAVLHRVRMVATVLGSDRSGTFVLSDVWRRGADGWQIWRRHSTPLDAGRLPGVD